LIDIARSANAICGSPPLIALPGTSIPKLGLVDVADKCTNLWPFTLCAQKINHRLNVSQE
jgi:hypothetical protein